MKPERLVTLKGAEDLTLSRYTCFDPTPSGELPVMANESPSKDDIAQNTGARTTAIDTDPSEVLEQSQRAAAGESPNSAGSTAPSTAEEHIPSTSDPEATDLPTASRPS